jgi:predicted nucleic acid-binding Zn ribbon protein
MARRREEGRRTKPERVDAVIQTYLRTSGLAGRVTQAGIIPDWPRLVGPQVAAVTEPLRVTANGTLFVAVASNPWMAELSLLEPQLLAAINAEPGRPAVKRIRWEARR